MAFVQIIAPSFIPDTLTEAYLVETSMVVCAASVTNVTAASITISVYVAANLDVPAAKNMVISERRVLPNETVVLSALKDQLLVPGKTIHTVASTASSAVMFMTGLEV